MGIIISFAAIFLVCYLLNESVKKETREEHLFRLETYSSVIRGLQEHSNCPNKFYIQPGLLCIYFRPEFFPQNTIHMRIREKKLIVDISVKTDANTGNSCCLKYDIPLNENYVLDNLKKEFTRIKLSTLKQAL